MNTDFAYSFPIRNDICVSYTYYNPGGDPVILANALALEAKLKAANIPYFNAEVLFSGAKPVLVEPTLTLSSNSALFYKESVWNLLEKKIPSNFTKVCFMDVNLKYTREDWLDCLSLMLNFYDVIQPYSDIQYLDVSGSVVKTEVGAVKSGSLKAQDNIWGMTRNFFQKIGGFLDKSVVSPNLLFSALTAPNTPLEFPLIDASYNEYAANVNATGSKICFLKCTLLSLPNGNINDTSAAMGSLKADSSDWNSMMTMNASGLWEVKDASVDAAFKALYRNSGVPVAEPVPIS
jgi:hypothetical protein